MHSHRLHALIVALLLAAAVTSAEAGAVFTKVGGNTSVSVYGAWDQVSGKPGAGVSLSSRQEQGLTDISATAFPHDIIVQSSQLKKLGSGALPLYVGMTAAYSFANTQAAADQLLNGHSTPTGLMTGISVVVAKAQPSTGLALDLRVSSMSKDVNPIKWISNPDMLLFGAGASYSF